VCACPCPGHELIEPVIGPEIDKLGDDISEISLRIEIGGFANQVRLLSLLSTQPAMRISYAA
jgi:hypothetical protein